MHRRWSLAIPAEFRTPVPHEIALSVASSALLHNVPELSHLTFLSIHCLLRPADARQLRWCDVKILDGSLSTRCEKVYGIVDIRELTTRRMVGDAQQQVLLECHGICQLVNTMKSSILDHRFATAIWKLTAAQHFAYFQRQLRNLGVSHQHYTHGLRGGGATRHWLQCLDLPQLRRRGRWTSGRTLERYIQEGKFVTSPKPTLQRSCRPSRRSRRARASFLCRTRLRRVPPPAPTATTLQRER